MHDGRERSTVKVPLPDWERSEEEPPDGRGSNSQDVDCLFGLLDQSESAFSRGENIGQVTPLLYRISNADEIQERNLLDQQP